MKLTVSSEPQALAVGDEPQALAVGDGNSTNRRPLWESREVLEQSDEALVV